MALLEYSDPTGKRQMASAQAPAPVGSGEPSSQVVSVLIGAHVTPAIDLAAQRLHSILFPTGMPAVDITFDVSPDGVTYGALFLGAGEYSIPGAVVAQARLIAVDSSLFYAYRYIKIRTGLVGAPADQAAQRDLTLLTGPR